MLCSFCAQNKKRWKFSLFHFIFHFFCRRFCKLKALFGHFSSFHMQLGCDCLWFAFFGIIWELLEHQNATQYYPNVTDSYSESIGYLGCAFYCAMTHFTIINLSTKLQFCSHFCLYSEYIIEIVCYSKTIRQIIIRVKCAFQ